MRTVKKKRAKVEKIPKVKFPVQETFGGFPAGFEEFRAIANLYNAYKFAFPISGAFNIAVTRDPIKSIQSYRIRRMTQFICKH